MENSKSSHTTCQSTRSSLKTSEEVDDPRTRTSNFQPRSGWRGEWRRGGARARGGRSRCQSGEKSEVLTVLPRGGGKRQLPG